MTATHERIRKDAEFWLNELTCAPGGGRLEPRADRLARYCLELLDQHPTVDACIIAALETKLEETERELALAIKRAAAAEARLASALEALADWGTPEPRETT